MNNAQLLLFEMPWPTRDLEQYPQLAVLSALFAAADAARLALTAAHQKYPDEKELQCALERLLNILASLIEALHGYHQALHRAHRAASPRLVVPTTLSAQQANTVFEFLHRVAEVVWDTHEPELLKLASQQSYPHDGDIPF